MHKLFIILLLTLCINGLSAQTDADILIDKITGSIAGTWRLIPEKNSKAKKSEFNISINAVQATETKNLYKMTGTIVGFAIEDGYAYYKGDVLVFGYTRTDIIEINPMKKVPEYITGSIQDGKLTLITYSPTSPSRIMSGTIWERPN